MSHRHDHSPPTKRMTCDVCTKCWEQPKNPGRCIYGGPFLGFMIMEPATSEKTSEKA